MLNVVFRVLNPFVNSSENFFACQRHNTFVVTVSDHRIRLPRPCLSICEQTCVISFERVVKYFLTLQILLINISAYSGDSTYHILEDFSLIGVIRARFRSHVTIRFHVKSIVTPITEIESKLFHFTCRLSKFLVKI